MRHKLNVVDYGIHAILIVAALIMIVPFYNVVLQSLATPAAIAKQPIYLIPTTINFTSFKVIFENKAIWSAIRISSFVTIVGMLINMIITTCGAYALTKKHMPGQKLFIGLVIFQMLFHGGLIPTYLTMKNYGLLNSLLAMIIPIAVNTYYLIIMMSYFRTIPDALEESAKIDGANDIQILSRIVLPISMPTLATICLFYSVERWNEWYNAMIYLKDSSKFPLQLYLREMLASASVLANSDLAATEISDHAAIYTNGLKMAMVVVTTLPILLVYPWLQKYFTAGVMIGSVKE
ncbi:ABC transporter permease [Paenibacillus pectinilyticus]|uniref:ABC transporter permease n=1 Tax=Paenibacillus pectinilyticus TaxID=512399 RepID=A0A1C1A3N9_9BACL|nr:carbohydrate ABC transporter permease [Paenibacillus pectinilyticus]OCT15177.1 ABC transporter permease [Paenibacillus pectinilyticus]